MLVNRKKKEKKKQISKNDQLRSWERMVGFRYFMLFIFYHGYWLYVNTWFLSVHRLSLQMWCIYSFVRNIPNGDRHNFFFFFNYQNFYSVLFWMKNISKTYATPINPYIVHLLRVNEKLYKWTARQEIIRPCTCETIAY